MNSKYMGSKWGFWKGFSHPEAPGPRCAVNRRKYSGDRMNCRLYGLVWLRRAKTPS
jgi:hypothetical protein